MELQFTKMHGLGNDFVMLDGIRHRSGHQLDLTPGDIRRLGDRRTGIGFDQLLIARPPVRGDCHLAVDIFNSDGSSARQCGNGMRCLALFAAGIGVAGQRCLRVELGGKAIEIEPVGQEEYAVNMGPPGFAPADVPFVGQVPGPGLRLDLGEEQIELGVVSVGNPHGVMRVDELAAAPVHTLAPRVQASAVFPEGVNVGFMEVVDGASLRLRVYERGAGETRACGSGACAAVAVGRLLHGLDSRVTVHLPGGAVIVDWPGESCDIWLRGPATKVYEGTVTLQGTL